MIVYEVHHCNFWPEKNAARFLFTCLVADEQQIEIIAETHKIFVGFWKGEFTISVDGRVLASICDSGEVKANPLVKAFLETRYELTKQKGGYEGSIESLRDLPAQVLWDYVCATIPKLEQMNTIKFIVHLPGRNGMAEKKGLKLARKDW